MQTKPPQSLYTQSPKLNQLNILKEVAANAKVTQAELAKRCGLSVAMVNNYMKELCGSGLLEYHRRSIKNVTYHLTPEGQEHLKILQAELISEMVGMFVAAKEQIRDRIVDQAKAELRRVVLIGSGSLAQLAFHALELADANIVGICSDKPGVAGTEFCGREILNASQIRYLAPDAVIVADSHRAAEICQNLDFLTDQGIEIIRLDGLSEFNAVGYLKPDSPDRIVTDLLNN